MITVNELLDVIDTEDIDPDAPIEVFKLDPDDRPPVSLEVAGVFITEDRRLRVEVL